MFLDFPNLIFDTTTNMLEIKASVSSQNPLHIVQSCQPSCMALYEKACDIYSLDAGTGKGDVREGGKNGQTTCKQLV